MQTHAATKKIMYDVDVIINFRGKKSMEIIMILMMIKAAAAESQRTNQNNVAAIIRCV